MTVQRNRPCSLDVLLACRLRVCTGGAANTLRYTLMRASQSAPLSLAAGRQHCRGWGDMKVREAITLAQHVRLKHPASLRAGSDRDAAAGGFDRFGGEGDVGDLLHARLLRLLDVAIGDTVVDRP